MIKYIGSKRKLLPRILAMVESLSGVRTVCDLFTGTTRVAQALKKAGYHVTANDVASYSEVLASAYIEADADRVDGEELRRKLSHLAELPGRDGYFTETFCRRARFFQPRNGRRIDAIRDEIDLITADRLERAILLTSLLEAADRVDSTTGVQMAFLKHWAPRAHRDLDLRVPRLLPGSGVALRMNARDLAPRLGEVDLCYIDPPYNQHSYFSNYHVWETLIRNDQPETYGVACKRTDCRTMKSPFNSKGQAWDAFAALVRSIDARHLLVSFNDEGFFSRAQIVELLRERRAVACIPVQSRRYVGAQIGVHNPAGERVGDVSHLHNTEYLFLAGEEAHRMASRVGGHA